MKRYEEKAIQTVSDVLCDVCGASTVTEHGAINSGTLQAHWGYGSQHDGEIYELDLCEGCFFATVAHLKRERQTQRLFSDDKEEWSESFGLVTKESL